MVRRRHGAGGYAMVALIVIVAVMGVLVAGALPYWSQIIKRDKEAELIFRGLQYAEAIRVFQVRIGRLPNTLDELIKTNPRSIRRLWKDPMTDDGEWDLVRAAANRGAPDQSGRGQDVAAGTAPGDDDGERRRQGPGQAAVGPIFGVKSRSQEASVREFMGAGNYANWQFTVELIPMPVTIPDTLLIPRPTSDWVGKPFRQGLEPQQGGGPRDLGAQRDEDDDG